MENEGKEIIEDKVVNDESTPKKGQLKRVEMPKTTKREPVRLVEIHNGDINNIKVLHDFLMTKHVMADVEQLVMYVRELSERIQNAPLS